MLMKLALALFFDRGDDRADTGAERDGSEWRGECARGFDDLASAFKSASACACDNACVYVYALFVLLLLLWPWRL